MTERQRSRWFNRLELLILAVGIGLRVVRFADRRPLWLDEALLALNIFRRHPLGYLHPLDDNQISPLGFLWGEWIVTELAGNGEKALRFLPLVAAIAALIAFARLARRILEPWAAFLATALASLSPLLIYYSAEVKSYGFDWLGAILVAHATLTVIENASRDAWIRWGLAAALSALVSTAAPFFIAGSALALLAAPHVRRDPHAFIRIAAAGTPAALVFGLHLLTVYRSPSTTSFMQVYWTETFLVQSVPAALRQAALIVHGFWNAVLFGDGVVEALPRRTMTIVVATSALGAFALGRRSLPTAVLLLAPAVLAAVASLAKWWPLTPRLLLFAVPAVLVTLPYGLATMARLAPRNARIPVQVILSVALIVAAAVGLPGEMRAQPRFIAVPEALRELGVRHSPNATVYLSSDIGPACTYYLAWHPDRATLGGDSSSRDCTLRGTRTVIGQWPRFVGLAPGRATRAAKTIRPEWLEREGRRILDQPATELWVLIGNNPELRAALPSWLESAGAMRLAEHETRGIRILTYRVTDRK